MVLDTAVSRQGAKYLNGLGIARKERGPARRSLSASRTNAIHKGNAKLVTHCKSSFSSRRSVATAAGQVSLISGAMGGIHQSLSCDTVKAVIVKPQKPNQLSRAGARLTGGAEHRLYIRDFGFGKQRSCKFTRAN